MIHPPFKASIIVPVYRDWDVLRGLMAALSVQSRDDVELIVVNNDPEQQSAPDNLPNPGLDWRIAECPTPGSYAARNVGAQLARSDFLIFTDADCRPALGWLEAYLEEPKPANTLFAGPVIMQASPNPEKWEIFDTVRGLHQEVFIRHGYAMTANLAVPRVIFDKLAGFDARRLSGGDAEFCRRARRNGYDLLLEPKACVYHPARKSRTALILKARRIKGGQVATGPLLRRVVWTIRSLMPPMREMLVYALSSHPLSWRLIACHLRLVLWKVELCELFRLLLLSHSPERR
jgi:glycosyltransferase involved in cell wall biosynthesis